MPSIQDYEKQVYASVLGKTIGVYLGRPFEGWDKKRLEEIWGQIDRYVHEDRKLPLVVADDDLSGTFGFVRALEDSGLYADTPPEFFGKMWLDYLIEGKTVLWWGGLGHSTEHTAYLRLKQGVPSPRSGSIELNGPAVAEQIGAQIFCDAFGMVAPGNPALAARLARMSAEVSHDGEAVHAAALVAAMVSAAFVEKKMDKIIAAGLAQIPEKSLIARMHREIAVWVKKDRDWRKTFDRIEKKYGYDTYGGNCHVIPNHAVMVLAWLYAPDDFHRALTIVNTAGWDTDCNSGNVGSVMALVVGLDRICEKYDYRTPFADRLILPTADGSRVASDCLTEALHISRIGRRIMGMRPEKAPKKGAWNHFEMDGALHGYMADRSSLATSGVVSVQNVAGHSKLGRRSMRVAFETSIARIGLVSTQTVARQENAAGGYGIMATPKIYPGNTVTVSGVAGSIVNPARLRLFIRTLPEEDGISSIILGDPLALKSAKPFQLTFTVPDLGGKVAGDFGLQIESDGVASGELFVDAVTIGGRVKTELHHGTTKGLYAKPFIGFILDTDMNRGPFSDDESHIDYFGKNRGQGVVVTGNTDWSDYVIKAEVRIHLAERGGIMARFKGLTRHLSLQLVAGNKVRLISKYYDSETVLDEKNFKWEFDKIYALELRVDKETVTGLVDGKPLLRGRDTLLGSGGAGLVWTDGIIGMRELKIS